jgi:hypothetical protein
MKRLMAIFLVLAALAAPAFAQMGDARAKGLAGAMTAVGDDMNALFFNPAGLAFVRKGYFNVEGSAGFGLNQSLIDPFSNAVPNVYSNWNGYTGESSYFYTPPGETWMDLPFVFGNTIDGLGGNDEAWLPQLTALAAKDGKTYGSLTPDEKLFYIQMLRSPNSLYSALQGISASPRIIVGGPHWGLSGFAEYQLTPSYAGLPPPVSVDTFTYAVSRRMGAIAGLGFALGPIAIGANAKFVKVASYFDDINLYSSGMQLQEVLSYEAAPGEEYSYVEVGLGALLTLGTLNLGVYNDNVMPFLNKENTAPFIDSFLDTMTFGLSWMPSDDKFRSRKSAFVLMTTADFRNFGDEYNRQLCAGVEAGLNVRDFLVALLRCGYTQSLPGPLSEMASAFKPENGTVSLGLTAKLWALKLDAAYSLPVSMITSTYGTELSDAERAMDFMKVDVTVALSL